MLNSIIMATIGGALIGLAASLLLIGAGRIAGISGIVGALTKPGTSDRSWRMLFIGGLLVGGLIILSVSPSAIAAPTDRSLLTIGAAGLLVGVGTRMSNGCTSGHGVCGLSRLSGRSLVATLSFMATGFATATLIQVIWGGQL